uniref:Polyprenol reductase n=1 Tax=Ascaris lumbricoides TaxID=6252 RepID=A0A0M3ICP4_ASCLU
MCKFVRIADQFTHVCGLPIRNKVIVCFLATGQLIVTAISLAQHVFSVVHFKQIFHCSFNETLTSGNGSHSHFLSHDVIIFDFGLFHELIQVQECIANYLDGGYMRCLWCIGQLFALGCALFSILCIRKAHPLYLWPVLIMQNAYCFGLMILTIATADKLLVSILHPLNGHLNLLIAAFFIGTSANHIFDYILWHFYWHRESEYMSRTGQHVIPFWV